MSPLARCSNRTLCKTRGGGGIRLTIVGQYYIPYLESPLNVEAAERDIDYKLGWLLLLFGGYPKRMRDIVKDRLPTFIDKEKELVKGSFDFIGINYYITRYAKNVPKTSSANFAIDQAVDDRLDKNGVLISSQASGSMFIYVYPLGLLDLLQFI
ncbi:hypothetical protein SLA2020_039460 [Shorea laevis]